AHISIPSEDDRGSGVPGAELAAVAVRDRQPGALDLSGRGTTQLPGGFYQQEDAAHARMVGRESATIGVERRRPGPVPAQPAALDVLAALALLGETEVFQDGQHGDGERVVDHRDVDLVRTDPGLTERGRSGDRRRAGRDVPAVARIADRFA